MVNMKRVLDVGAQSLLVPYVSDADEARARGSAYALPARRACAASPAPRARRASAASRTTPSARTRRCACWCRSRRKAALDSIEAICAIDGVDGVFIGPADLHASMGYTGEIANPKVKPLIDDAIRRIRKAGKAPGILTPNEADARHWLECGALFVAVGSDVGILARGAEALAAKFKS